MCIGSNPIITAIIPLIVAILMYYFSVLMTERPGMIMKLLGAFYYTISSLAISTISGMSDIAQLVELPVEQRSCLCLTAFFYGRVTFRDSGSRSS